MTYEPKVYRSEGGDKLIVASGGELEVQSGGTLDVQAGATLDFDADISFGDDEKLKFGDSDDITIEWDTAATPDELQLMPLTNNSNWKIGTTTLSLDLEYVSSAGTMIIDASANTVDFNGIDINLQDDDLLAFGDANDVTLDWDTSGTDQLKILPLANNTIIAVGTSTASADIQLNSSAGQTVTFDASANEIFLNGADLWLKDDDQLEFGDSSDIVMDWSAGGGFLVAGAATNSVFAFGAAGNQLDVTLYGSAGTVTFDASADTHTYNAVDLKLGDDDMLYFGDSDDVVMDWSAGGGFLVAGAATNSVFAFGAAGNQFDVTYYGSAGTVTFDASAQTHTYDQVDVVIGDDDMLIFGDSSDIVMDWSSGGGFLVAGAATNSAFAFGAAGNQLDVVMYGSAGTVTFDASAKTHTYDQIDVKLGDDDMLYFGDSDDVVMDWSAGGGFLVAGAATNSAFTFGAAGNQFDVVMYGSGSNLTFDASANHYQINGARVDLNSTATLQLNLLDGASTASSYAGALRVYTNSTGTYLGVCKTGTTWVWTTLA